MKFAIRDIMWATALICCMVYCTAQARKAEESAKHSELQVQRLIAENTSSRIQSASLRRSFEQTYSELLLLKWKLGDMLKSKEVSSGN